MYIGKLIFIDVLGPCLWVLENWWEEYSGDLKLLFKYEGKG